MIEPHTIELAASSLKSAAEIAKSLLSLRDGSQIKTKVIELQSTILAAQSEAMSAQAEQLNLLQRVRDLQNNIEKLETELNSLRGAPKIPEARICPLCQSEMRVTAEHPDSTFHFAGVMVHMMECTKCQNKTTRRYKPGKGYS